MRSRTMSETTGRVVLASGLAVMLTLLLFGLQAAKSAQAATTFTVTSVADSGDATLDGTCGSCTLREAIQEANALVGADTIDFAIPGAGPHTIAPLSELPAITGPVTIDGYTEARDETTPANANTSTDAVLRIVLSGAGAGTFKTGLHIDAPDVMVRGLVINNWNNYGIDVLANGSGARIEGNFIGTDAAGTSAPGNRLNGVTVSNTSGVTVGGASPDRPG